MGRATVKGEGARDPGVEVDTVIDVVVANGKG